MIFVLNYLNTDRQRHHAQWFVCTACWLSFPLQGRPDAGRNIWDNFKQLARSIGRPTHIQNIFYTCGLGVGFDNDSTLMTLSPKFTKIQTNSWSGIWGDCPRSDIYLRPTWRGTGVTSFSVNFVFHFSHGHAARSCQASVWPEATHYCPLSRAALSLKSILYEQSITSIRALVSIRIKFYRSGNNL
jgi:hypothetical protein